MATSELHEEPFHYIFNTDLCKADPSIFHSPNNSVRSIGVQGRGTALFKSLQTQAGSLNVVMKKYQRGGMVRYFNRNLYWHANHTQSRVWCEFKLLLTLSEMGLPVPLPVAGQVKRTVARWYESTIITREIEHTETLVEYLLSAKAARPAAEKKLWRNVGQAIQQLHSASVYHADLNANNILIDNHDKLFVIDFDKSYFRSDNKDNWQKENLDRLERSLLKQQRQSKKRREQFQFSKQNWTDLITGYSTRICVAT